MDITYTYVGDVTDESIESIISNSTKIEYDIKVDKAAYAINSNGYVYPNVVVNSKEYVLLLLDLKSKLRDTNGTSDLSINIYTDTTDICVNDIYELYYSEINDTYIPEKSYQLFWKLKFRSLQDTPGISNGLSLIYSPVVCPSCGGELLNYEIDKSVQDELVEVKLIKRCINSDCWCHITTALERFIIIACNTNKYTRIVRTLVNNKIVKYPHQLFDASISDIISTGIYEKYAVEFNEFMEAIRGTIRISDYIRSLAYVDYKQDGFSINSSRIDDRFKTITEFIDYILNIGKYFDEVVDSKYINNEHTNNNICKTLVSWKDQFARDIEEYMSIPAFLSYYTYFKIGDKNIYAAKMLEEYKVFTG